MSGRDSDELGPEIVSRMHREMRDFLDLKDHVSDAHMSVHYARLVEGEIDSAEYIRLLARDHADTATLPVCEGEFGRREPLSHLRVRAKPERVNRKRELEVAYRLASDRLSARQPAAKNMRQARGRAMLWLSAEVLALPCTILVGVALSQHALARHVVGLGLASAWVAPLVACGLMLLTGAVLLGARWWIREWWRHTVSSLNMTIDHTGGRPPVVGGERAASDHRSRS